jgi:hypothetical protein
LFKALWGKVAGWLGVLGGLALAALALLQVGRRQGRGQAEQKQIKADMAVKISFDRRGPSIAQSDQPSCSNLSSTRVSCFSPPKKPRLIPPVGTLTFLFTRFGWKYALTKTVLCIAI